MSYIHEPSLRERLRRRLADVANQVVSVVVEDVIQRGDAAHWEDIRYRLNNQGHGRPQYGAGSPTNNSSSPGGAYSQYTMPSAKGNAPPTQNRHSTSGKCTFVQQHRVSLPETDTVRPDFKPSPFYEIVETVLPLQDLPGTYPEMLPFAKSTLTSLTQKAQKCRKTAIPPKPPSASLPSNVSA